MPYHLRTRKVVDCMPGYDTDRKTVEYSRVSSDKLATSSRHVGIVDFFLAFSPSLLVVLLLPNGFSSLHTAPWLGVT